MIYCSFSTNDGPPLCNIYINVTDTFPGGPPRRHHSRYAGNGPSQLWKWCQNECYHAEIPAWILDKGPMCQRSWVMVRNLHHWIFRLISLPFQIHTLSKFLKSSYILLVCHNNLTNINVNQFFNKLTMFGYLCPYNQNELRQHAGKGKIMS